MTENQAELEALRASFIKAAQVANEVTLETQTPEEMAVALVRLVFEARGLREAERARADSAERELAAVLENLDVASLNKALDEVRAERDVLREKWANALATAERVTELTNRPTATIGGLPVESVSEAVERVVKKRDALQARADRTLKVLRDLAAKYEPSADSHGVAYNTSPAAAAEWRAVAELLASEGSR